MLNSSQIHQSLPKVSVIVPIYNAEKDLPDLIDCLCQQTYPQEQVEYLLVNNNSSDRTSELLEIAAAKTSTQGHHIVLLTENQIQSSYAARNKGIKAAQYDILAFTDADCRPCADWLAKIVQSFQDSSVGIVVGEVVALPGETLLEKYADHYQLMSQKFLLDHPFYPYGQTANLAIRKLAFEQVGLFRPYLTTGGDADICWRIQKETDWKLAYAPEAIIRHRHRSNFKNFRSQWRRYGCSNRYLHELHGVDLMRDFTAKELVYRLSRWLLKEVPRDSMKLFFGKANPIELLKTPIDLMGFQARSQGQIEAKLPEEAKQIERF